MTNNNSNNSNNNSNSNGNNSKLRRTLCFAAAATATAALVQSNQVTAFTQPSQCSTSTTASTGRSGSTVVNNVFQSSDSTMEKNDINIHATALSDHNPQHGALPLIEEAAAVAAANTNVDEFFSSSLLYPNSSAGDLSAADDNCNSASHSSDEKTEFDIMIGRALDTIRSDYPDILTKDPDFSIYDAQIEVVDPKGITLHSLKSYKTSFQFLHMIIKLFYAPDDSGLTFRLVYDCARKSIRVSWNAELIPRVGGVRNSLHVDGISVYEFDRVTGLINQHRVEHLLINDAPVEAPQGIFRAIANQAMAGPDAEGVPVWNMNGGGSGSSKMSNVLEFTSPFKSLLSSSSPSSLFSSTTDGDCQHPLFDKEAFDRKNASRKKFGVPPLTPDEFVQIQAEVKAMETAQILKQQKSASAAELAKSKEPKGNFLGKMFGNILQDTCESNYDCERPEVCCDLGFKKMCCSSGARVFDMPGQLTKIPVRVVADDGMMPRGGPDGMDNIY